MSSLFVDLRHIRIERCINHLDLAIYSAFIKNSKEPDPTVARRWQQRIFNGEEGESPPCPYGPLSPIQHRVFDPTCNTQWISRFYSEPIFFLAYSTSSAAYFWNRTRKICWVFTLFSLNLLWSLKKKTKENDFLCTNIYLGYWLFVFVFSWTGGRWSGNHPIQFENWATFCVSRCYDGRWNSFTDEFSGNFKCNNANRTLSDMVKHQDEHPSPSMIIIFLIL